MDSGEGATLRCANHPGVETHLRCSRCGKPICPRCVVQTPVGGRCRECANLKKLPVFQVGGGLFLRATLYGLVAALIGGFILAQTGSFFGLSGLLLLLLGYVVGEAVSRGANRRIAPGLAVMAGSLTVFGVIAGRAAAVLVRLPASMPMDVKLQAALGFGVSGLFGGLLGILFLVLAVVVAVSRVR